MLYHEMKDLFWLRTIELIKAHKISQKGFADYVGINYNVFRGWINHDRIPDAISSCTIADALGVTVEYLARGKDGMGAVLRMKQTEKRKIASEKIKKLVTELGEETVKLNE